MTIHVCIFCNSSLKPLKVKTVEHFLEVHRLWQFFHQWSDNRCMFYEKGNNVEEYRLF